jgi:hypothetical protein
MPEAGGWGQPTISATPVPLPPKKRRWPLIAALATGVVAIVVVVVLIVSGGSSLPDSLGSVARVDSGPMAEVMEAFDDMEFMGITFDVAVYGGGLMPKYMVMAMNGDMLGADSESLLTSFPSGVMSQNGATLDFDRAQTEQVGDTEYLCVPAEVDPAQAQPGFSGEMSMCMYQSPDRVAMVLDFDGADLMALMQVTKELHDALM